MADILVRSPVPMRRIDPKFGKFGYSLATAGAVSAWAAHLLPDFLTRLAMIMLGGTIYLIGSFLVVAAFDYRRGTGPFLFIRVVRMVFAGAAILMVMRVVTQPG